MKSQKMKYVLVITFICSLLLIYLGFVTAQIKANDPTFSEVKKAKLKQGLSGYLFQDSTTKKWFLEDREGNKYKFDENTRKWKKIEELSTSETAPEPPGPPVLIRDKYYVAVKALKLREQPDTRAKEVGSLNFRAKVEKLDQSRGWMQVRQRETNLTGWVPRWNLEKYPLERPLGYPVRRPTSPEPTVPDVMPTTK